MSIRVMSLVWDKFEGSGSELLAMLAMADWCNDAGGSCHPSIDALAKKIRVSESQARRMLRKLMADGFVSVIGNASGGAPGMSRHYKVHVDKLKAMPDIVSTGVTDDTPSMDATGSTGAQDGLHGCAETGGAGDTQTTNITTIEPPKKKRVKKESAAIQIPAVPDWVPVDAWAGYIAMRIEKRKAPTVRAVELLVMSLEKMRDAGHDISEVLNASTRNCWTDVYWPRGQQATKQTQAVSEKYRTSYDRTADIEAADRLNAAAGVKPRSDDDDPGEF